MTFAPPKPWDLYRHIAPLWRDAGAQPLDTVEALLTMVAMAKHQQRSPNSIYDFRHGELMQPVWVELHSRLAEVLDLPLVGSPLEDIAARAPGLLEQTRRALAQSFPVIADDGGRHFAHGLLDFFLHGLQTGLRDPSIGYFRWPRYLAPLFLGLLGRPSKKEPIYCPFDNSGLLAAVLADNGWTVHCELINHQAVRILLLFAFIGDWHLKVQIGDPVQNPQWVSDEKLIYFNNTAAITSFGSRYEPPIDRYARFPVRSFYGETFQIEHMMAQTSGRLLCVVPESFLFRTAGGEREYKEWLVRRGMLSCVIRLPRDVFGAYAKIPSSIVLFDTVPSRRSDDVLFIDFANMLSDEEITPSFIDILVDETISIVNKRRQSQNSVLVGQSEIAAQDFNISADRYVLHPELRRQRELLEEQGTIPLGDLVELYRAQARPKRPTTSENGHTTVREVATGDVQDGFVEMPARITEIPAHQLRYVDRAILQGGDILISIKGKVGVVGLVPDQASVGKSEAWVAGQTFVIARLRRSTPLISPAVLVAYLASPFGQTQLQALARGAYVPLIQMADLKRLEIPLPPSETQKRIIHQFEQIPKLRERIQEIEGKIQEVANNLSNLFVKTNER
jgi:type I restriction enzyme M protein